VVETRAYRSPRRDAQARLTRRRVLEAATASFLTRGYAGTTMRAVAGEAGVSVATVELLFGTKVALLEAAIDVAIAGDDEPVAVLDRAWADAARRAATAPAVLALAADVLTAAQQRSSGLVLAVFEAARSDPALEGLAAELTARRRVTAQWLVDRLAAWAAVSDEDAVDTLWVLMDPAVFDRLVHRLGWSPDRYRTWFARTAARLLVHADATPEAPP
jgi:AcrR family transcriptional regulator